jgi:hypothetical protein
LKAVLTIVITAIISVALLYLGIVAMEKRHEARGARASEEADCVVDAIKADAVLTNLQVCTSIAGVWYLGVGAIRIYGEAPSQSDIERLRLRVHDLDLSFPVKWEIRYPGEPEGTDVVHDSQWREQLEEVVLTRLVSFWGFSPLLFPAIVITLLGLSKSIRPRRVLVTLLLAWSLWIFCLTTFASEFWHWSSILDGIFMVLPPAVAWGIVTKEQSRGSAGRALRLLLPCAIPIAVDVLYCPINAGYLVHRFGCGCKLEGINANHITYYFFVLISIVTLISTGIVSRRDSLRFRLIHLVVVGGFTFWLCRQVMYGNIWM